MTLLALAMAISQRDCTPGGEYEPSLCPTHLPAIASLLIEESGVRAWSDPQGPKSCRSFRPTAGQIRTYFARARQTSPESADATVVEVPCVAIGRVRFADGRRARWYIQQYRFGRMWFANGRAMLLYCRRCPKPFVND